MSDLQGNIIEVFATNVRIERARQKRKVREIAATAGISRETWAKAENGKPVGMETAAAMAVALGVPLDRLLRAA